MSPHSLYAPLQPIFKKKTKTNKLHEHTPENRREPPPSAHWETSRDQSSPCASRCFSLSWRPSRSLRGAQQVSAHPERRAYCTERGQHSGTTAGAGAGGGGGGGRYTNGISWEVRPSLLYSERSEPRGASTSGGDTSCLTRKSEQLTHCRVCPSNFMLISNTFF